MRHLLLTISFMIFVSYSGFSQETKAVFFTHDLGKFYLYINNQLVDRAPQNQIEYTVNGSHSLIVKIVFQDHNLPSIKKEIRLKADKLSLYVIYIAKEVTKFDDYKKMKVGKYRPGYVVQKHNAMPQYKGRLGCDYPCNPSIIELSVNQMKSETSSMAQFTIARELVVNNCIIVADLKLVLDAFTHEKDKVAFAKFAWAYIYDQENFKNLESVFTEPGQMEQVLRFVMKNQ